MCEPELGSGSWEQLGKIDYRWLITCVMELLLVFSDVIMI